MKQLHRKLHSLIQKGRRAQMKTMSIAIKNLKKSFSFYALYLLSVSLVITVFFAFTSFSMNEVMLEKISENGRVETMCSAISVFLMVFVVFYMAYSNKFFLRRRTKELGIYALLGYRRTTILSMLTYENILICCGAFLVGVLLGALLHKGIVIGITVLLNLSIDSRAIPFFNLQAISKTAIFISIVVAVLGCSNGKFLLKTSLIDLVRFEKKAEPVMKFHPIPAMLGLIMIISGYGLALDIFRGNASLWLTVGFYPIGLLTMLLVVVGTVLLITFFLPYAMQKRKQNKRSFYNPVSIISVPNFIYRIRSNAKTLIMLTLLSAATLTVSSVMALTVYYPIAAVDRIAPSEFEFKIEMADQVDTVKRIINQTVPESEGLSFIQTDIYKVTSTANNLPAEYCLGTAKGDADNETILRESGFECISYSTYISLLEAQGKKNVVLDIPELADSECILTKYQPNSNGNSEVGNIYPLEINNDIVPVTVKATTLDNPISFANSIATLIVSDSLYHQIAAYAEPTTSVMSINGKAIEDNEELYTAISKTLNHSPYLQGHSHRIHELFWINSSTFLLIGCLVVLFFIASGSILYFNNVSAISDAKADYEMLIKMGYTDKQIKKIIRKQTFTFYTIPFVLGLLDCVFATVVYKIALMQNLLGNALAQYLPVILAIVLTVIIYLVYYFLTAFTCNKIIVKK